MHQPFRRVRITTYLDVPVFVGDETNEMSLYTDEMVLQDVQNTIQEHTPCILNSESEIVSEEFSELSTGICSTIENPAGFILPNGQIFLQEDRVNPLVHLSLAQAVYNLCEQLGYTQQIEPNMIDRSLELMGVIRVHNADVRYLAHEQYYTRDNSIRYTPDPSLLQLQTLSEYCSYHGYEGRLFLPGGRFTPNELRQMDTMALRNAFNNRLC